MATRKSLPKGFIPFGFGHGKIFCGDKATLIKASQSKLKGKLELMGGLMFTMEAWGQLPDKFKHVTDIEINNMNITVTQGFDGKKFWISVMGKTKEIDDEKLVKEIKENLYVEQVTNLTGLKDKKYELSALGEVKVNDKAAVGVRVSAKGRRDVNLYFDKENHRIVKSEFRSFDIMTQKETNVEKIYSNYKEVQGVQTPMRIVVQQDGQPFLDLEISEVRYLEKHDASIFAKPE
jgi:translation elongation factor EF-1beta